MQLNTKLDKLSNVLVTLGWVMLWGTTPLSQWILSKSSLFSSLPRAQSGSSAPYLIQILSSFCKLKVRSKMLAVFMFNNLGKICCRWFSMVPISAYWEAHLIILFYVTQSLISRINTESQTLLFFQVDLEPTDNCCLIMVCKMVIFLILL